MKPRTITIPKASYGDRNNADQNGTYGYQSQFSKEKQALDESYRSKESEMAKLNGEETRVEPASAKTENPRQEPQYKADDIRVFSLGPRRMNAIAEKYNPAELLFEQDEDNQPVSLMDGLGRRVLDMQRQVTRKTGLKISDTALGEDIKTSFRELLTAQAAQYKDNAEVDAEQTRLMSKISKVFATLEVHNKTDVKEVALTIKQSFASDFAKLAAPRILLGDNNLDYHHFGVYKEGGKPKLVALDQEIDVTRLNPTTDLFSKKNGIHKYGKEVVFGREMAEALANLGQINIHQVAAELKADNVAGVPTIEQLQTRQKKLKEQGYALLIENCFDKNGKFVDGGQEKLKGYVAKYGDDFKKFIQQDFKKSSLKKHDSSIIFKNHRLRTKMQAQMQLVLEPKAANIHTKSNAKTARFFAGKTQGSDESSRKNIVNILRNKFGR